MLQITVNHLINLSPEALEVAKLIFGGFAPAKLESTEVVGETLPPSPNKRGKKETPKPEAKSDNHPEEQKSEVEETAKEVEETPVAQTSPGNSPAYTVEQVRAIAAETKARLGSNDKMRAVIVDMGFKDLPSMTAERYPEFIEKIKAL